MLFIITLLSNVLSSIYDYSKLNLIKPNQIISNLRYGVYMYLDDSEDESLLIMTNKKTTANELTSLAQNHKLLFFIPFIVPEISEIMSILIHNDIVKYINTGCKQYNDKLCSFSAYTSLEYEIHKSESFLGFTKLKIPDDVNNLYSDLDIKYELISIANVSDMAIYTHTFSNNFNLFYVKIYIEKLLNTPYGSFLNPKSLSKLTTLNISKELSLGKPYLNVKNVAVKNSLRFDIVNENASILSTPDGAFIYAFNQTDELVQKYNPEVENPSICSVFKCNDFKEDLKNINVTEVIGMSKKMIAAFGVPLGILLMAVVILALLLYRQIKKGDLLPNKPDLKKPLSSGDGIDTL